MVSEELVQEELRNLLRTVIGDEAAEMPLETTLKTAGVDSLSILEICEALGSKFQVKISDKRIDNIQTLEEIVGAVLASAKTAKKSKPAKAKSEPSVIETLEEETQVTEPTVASESLSEEPDAEESVDTSRVWSMRIFWFLLLGGIVTGTAIGYTNTAGPGGEAPDATSLMRSVDPSAKPSTGQSPAESESGEGQLQATPTETTGGRFVLAGSLPVAPGTGLQVQRKNNGQWEDFPVKTTAKGEQFTINIQSSKKGVNEFRVQGADGKVTPSVFVTIR